VGSSGGGSRKSRDSANVGHSGRRLAATALALGCPRSDTLGERCRLGCAKRLYPPESARRQPKHHRRLFETAAGPFLKQAVFEDRAHRCRCRRCNAIRANLADETHHRPSCLESLAPQPATAQSRPQQATIRQPKVRPGARSRTEQQGSSRPAHRPNTWHPAAAQEISDLSAFRKIRSSCFILTWLKMLCFPPAVVSKDVGFEVFFCCRFFPQDGPASPFWASGWGGVVARSIALQSTVTLGFQYSHRGYYQENSFFRCNESRGVAR